MLRDEVAIVSTSPWLVDANSVWRIYHSHCVLYQTDLMILFVRKQFTEQNGNHWDPVAPGY